MKKPTLPAWMRSGRPDAAHKNCLNVQEGIVEASDFDPAMCQACETTACKWHPDKRGPDRDGEDLEEEDDEADEPEADPYGEPEHESGAVDEEGEDADER